MLKLLNLFLVIAIFGFIACGGVDCEGGGCRDKIKSHGKIRGR